MIRLYTSCSHRSDLIPLQLRSFRLHINQSDFTFVVFNNAQSPDMFSEISQVCRRLHIPCIEVQRDDDLVERLQVYEPRFPLFNKDGKYTTNGIGNEYSLCWAWENYLSRQFGYVAWLHSDIFFTAPFTPSTYLSQYDLCYVPQRRPGIREYMWDGLALFNMSRIPSPESLCWMGGYLSTDPEIAGDTGTVTSLYLDAHPDLRIAHIQPKVMTDDISPRSSRPWHELLSLDGQEIALHYISATNWDEQDPEYHKRKTEWLKARLGL